MKIGNINNLPWYARLGLFGVLAVLVYGAFWYFVTNGTRKETKALQDQIVTLQKANMEMQVASQRLNEFRTAYIRAGARATQPNFGKKLADQLGIPNVNVTEENSGFPGITKPGRFPFS